MKPSFYRLLAVGLAAGLGCVTAINARVSAEPVETLDVHTQRNSMHACPQLAGMTGLSVAANELLCTNDGNYDIDAEREIVDFATQRNGMHSCPRGYVMTGVHVDENRLSCAPLSRPDVAAWREYADGWTQRDGMHACPPGYFMTGVNVAHNIFNCAKWDENEVELCQQRGNQCLFCWYCPSSGAPVSGCNWGVCQ